MENDLAIIASLAPDQLVERAKALQLEAEYWSHVLTDCKTSAAALRGVVSGIIDSTTSALALVIQLEPGLRSHAESVVASNRMVMDSVEEVIGALDGIVALADGRAKALEPVGAAVRRAAGLPVDDDDDEPAS